MTEKELYPESKNVTLFPICCSALLLIRALWALIPLKLLSGNMVPCSALLYIGNRVPFQTQSHPLSYLPRPPSRPDQTSGAQSLDPEQWRLLPPGYSSTLLCLDGRVC